MSSVQQEFMRSMKRKYNHLTKPDVSPGLPQGAIPNAAQPIQGFTGRGPQNEPAGQLSDGSVVHGQEMVLPAGQVQAAGGPAAVEQTLNEQAGQMRTEIPRGFALGTSTLLSGANAVADHLKNSSEELNKETDGGIPSPGELISGRRAGTTRHPAITDVGKFTSNLSGGLGSNNETENTTAAGGGIGSSLSGAANDGFTLRGPRSVMTGIVNDHRNRQATGPESFFTRQRELANSGTTQQPQSKLSGTTETVSKPTEVSSSTTTEVPFDPNNDSTNVRAGITKRQGEGDFRFAYDAGGKTFNSEQEAFDFLNPDLAGRSSVTAGQLKGALTGLDPNLDVSELGGTRNGVDLSPYEHMTVGELIDSLISEGDIMDDQDVSTIRLRGPEDASITGDENPFGGPPGEPQLTRAEPSDTATDVTDAGTTPAEEGVPDKPEGVEFNNIISEDDRPDHIKQIEGITPPTDAELDAILESDDFKKFTNLLSEEIQELKKIARGEGTASKVSSDIARRKLALQMAAQGQLNRNRAAQLGMTGGELNATMARQQFNNEMSRAGFEGRMAVKNTEAAEDAILALTKIAETGRGLEAARGQFEASLKQKWAELGLTEQEIKANIQKWNNDMDIAFDRLLLDQEEFGTEVALANLKNSNEMTIAIGSQLKDNPEAYKGYMKSQGIDLDMDNELYMQNRDSVNAAVTDVMFNIQNFNPGDDFMSDDGSFSSEALNSSTFDSMLKLYNMNNPDVNLSKDAAAKDAKFKNWANKTFVMQRAKTTVARGIIESFGSEAIEGMILNATDADGNKLWNNIEEFEFGNFKGVEAATMALANIYAGGGVTYDPEGNMIPDYEHMGNQLLGIKSRPLNNEEMEESTEEAAAIIEGHKELSDKTKADLLESLKVLPYPLTGRESESFHDRLRRWKPGDPLPGPYDLPEPLVDKEGNPTVPYEPIPTTGTSGGGGGDSEGDGGEGSGEGGGESGGSEFTTPGQVPGFTTNPIQDFRARSLERFRNNRTTRP